MSTPHRKPAASPRQQLVTALLVGTVVIVLGFASGLGVDTRTSAATPGSIGTSATAGSPPVAQSTRTPVNYVGVGTLAPPVAQFVAGAAPTATPLPSSATATATPSTVALSPVPTSGSSPTCSPDLLAALLDALLGGTAKGGGLLGSLGGLLSPLGGPLGPITALLPSVLSGLGQSPTGATPQLASTCAASAAGMLPLLAGLR